MSRFNDQERKDAARASSLMAMDLIRISLGCTDSDYTTQSACELNSETWTDDILITTYTSDKEVTIDGQTLTFQTSRDLLSMSDVEESLNMDIGTLSLGLSGISGLWLELSQTVELNNRTVEIWRAFLDPVTREVINAPFKYFAGTIVTGVINKSVEGEGSIIEIEVSNHFYNFQSLSGFRCNVNDHQKFFPNDTGFEQTSSIQREINWGNQ